MVMVRGFCFCTLSGVLGGGAISDNVLPSATLPGPPKADWLIVCAFVFCKQCDKGKCARQGQGSAATAVQMGLLAAVALGVPL